MVRSHILSSRKKALFIIASVLFMAFAVIGYTRYSNNASANTLVAQEDESSPGVNENDRQFHQNDFKGKQAYLKDLKQGVKEIRKETKNTVSTAAVDEFMNKFSSCLTTLKPKIGFPDYWDLARDCDFISSDIQAELRDNLGPARECYQNKRGIEDRKKEKKNNNQIKEILKNNKDADVSPLKAIAAQIDEQFARAAAAMGCTSADDNDVLQDVSSELNSLLQDFYDTSDAMFKVIRETQQLEESKKDFDSNFKKNCGKQLKRELNDYEKEIGAFQKKVSLTADQQATYDNVKSLYADLCTTILANMEQALAVNDNETFQTLRKDFVTKENDLRTGINELRYVWNEDQQSVQDEKENIKNFRRDLKEKKRNLTRMKKELKRTNKLFNRTAKKYLDKAEIQEALKVFAGYVAQADELATRMEAALTAAKEEAENPDPDPYWGDRSDELNDLQNEFNGLQSNIENLVNTLQMIKGAERGLKSAKKDLTNIRRESNGDPELMKSLEDLLSETRELLQQAWSSFVTDPEEAMDALQEIQQLENDWNTTVQDWRESKDYVDKE